MTFRIKIYNFSGNNFLLILFFVFYMIISLSRRWRWFGLRSTRYPSRWFPSANFLKYIFNIYMVGRRACTLSTRANRNARKNVKSASLKIDRFSGFQVTPKTCRTSEFSRTGWKDSTNSRPIIICERSTWTRRRRLKTKSRFVTVRCPDIRYAPRLHRNCDDIWRHAVVDDGN